MLVIRSKLPDPNKFMHAFTNYSQICSHGVYIALGESFFPNHVTLTPDTNASNSKTHVFLSGSMNGEPPRSRARVPLRHWHGYRCSCSLQRFLDRWYVRY